MHHRSGQLRCPLLGPLRRRVPLRFVLPRDSSGWPLASTGDRPACLPAYLPTYLPTLGLTTFQPPPRESGKKSPGCLALRGVEIDRSIAS